MGTTLVELMRRLALVGDGSCYFVVVKLVVVRAGGTSPRLTHFSCDYGTVREAMGLTNAGAPMMSTGWKPMYARTERPRSTPQRAAPAAASSRSRWLPVSTGEGVLQSCCNPKWLAEGRT